MLFLLLLLTAVMSTVVAEIPNNDYDVNLIEQKTACPTIYCPWNCDRFMDANGCLFCGACTQRSSCPPIKCPNLPHFACVARLGRDGCTTCKCRAKPKCVGPVPLCSAACSLRTDADGCQRCSCPSSPPSPSVCPPPSNCARPDCWKERGADGCLHCACRHEQLSCPEVRCDPKKRCVHSVDARTGCATGCECELDLNSSQLKPAFKMNSARMSLPLPHHPLPQHPPLLKTPLRG